MNLLRENVKAKFRYDACDIVNGLRFKSCLSLSYIADSGSKNNRQFAIIKIKLPPLFCNAYP